MPEYLFDNLKFFKDFKKDSSTAIITDIDGTISEIAASPEEAEVSESMRSELIKLKETCGLLAVISGRSVEDAKRLVGIEDILYVGNHGMEYYFDGKYSLAPHLEKYLHSIKESSVQVNQELCDIPGILFEDKGICYAIHYRQCNDNKYVQRKIINTLKNCNSCKNLQISEGRKVVEIKPPVNYDKGTIIQQIIDKYHLKKIIYLGDDITDADAFKKLNELENSNKMQTRSIVVLSTEIPTYVKNSASFFVWDVNEVLKFFRWLIS